MSEFNLAEMLADMDLVSIPDTRELREIPVEQIHGDALNFYSIDKIDDLAASIELVGLQQPLLVRESEDGYTIVSGHRRFAAITMLRNEGNTKFETVPCLIDSSGGSEAWRELCLIYGNSQTRQLTGAELSKQAERVTELFYKLKEEGVEFPGRMRDHVAEACNVSKSKLARLAVIRNQLDDVDAREAWEKGKLPESVAYALAKLPTFDQMLICYAFTEATGRGIDCIQEWRVEKMNSQIGNIHKITCMNGGGCNFCGAKLKKLNTPGNCDMSCELYCCAACPKLASCSSFCVSCQREKEAAKEERKAEKLAEKAAKAEVDALKIEALNAIWARVAAACKKKGVAYMGAMNAAGLHEYNVPSKFVGYLEGKSCEANSFSPLDSIMTMDGIEKLRKFCDVLDVSADYLIGRTEE